MGDKGSKGIFSLYICLQTLKCGMGVHSEEL